MGGGGNHLATSVYFIFSKNKKKMNGWLGFFNIFFQIIIYEGYFCWNDIDTIDNLKNINNKVIVWGNIYTFHH
jgi:hypothetical protein